MKMTDFEFQRIQQLLQNNGDILTLRKDNGEITGFISYTVVIKNNLYVKSKEHHVNVTEDFVMMIRNVLKNYEVAFNNTRTTFWITSPK